MERYNYKDGGGEGEEQVGGGSSGVVGQSRKEGGAIGARREMIALNDENDRDEKDAGRQDRGKASF